MIPPAVQDWLLSQGSGAVRQTQPVSGGCINHCQRLVTASGETFFLKTNPDCPPDLFAKEVEGLQALKVNGGPRLPEAMLIGLDFLLLEDLAPAPPRKEYWPNFGRQMAALHQKTAAQFGFDSDNYIGSAPQVNPWTTDGFEFFAQHRLTAQGETAAQNGLLSRDEIKMLGSVASKLKVLIPSQPASILHGDLWSGNQITDRGGNPAIIDPAAYYGWAEADLAMMTLFGSPGSGFWESYTEVRPLAPGYRQRFELYNLYHLLNHLNLFGHSYHGQVIRTLQRFG